MIVTVPFGLRVMVIRQRLPAVKRTTFVICEVFLFVRTEFDRAKFSSESLFSEGLFMWLTVQEMNLQEQGAKRVEVSANELNYSFNTLNMSRFKAQNGTSSTLRRRCPDLFDLHSQLLACVLR